MRQRRGIDLTVGKPAFDMAEELGKLKIRELAEWHILGAQCSKCHARCWLDRWKLADKYGRETPLATLRPFLRCTACGNRINNSLVLGKMDRNA
ncbi:hypothetical protein B0E45_06260 [Sinorhizobium sp. A49]|uniref:hypothetical protein n=1 Tax=Sinorhizobium sp. A49 TaxID=1945861 RepID=UPI0009875A9A|nr:hypothetical protein [Sinorhizobium sp. A49]OOG73889.1 hypothetical protein B0E45_06260 [Sinorhizobium sp. A49]